MKTFVSTPDYRNIVSAAKNRPAPRMPLYEHIIGGRVMRDIIGTDPYAGMDETNEKTRDAAFADFWSFWHKMGYDTASFEGCITSILPGGGALGSHAEGCIKNRSDFERYPWEELQDLFFARFAPQFRSLARTCPPGMKAVGGVGNGIFECVQDLVGYMELCYLKEDDPGLYADLFTRMGDVQAALWARFLAEDYADVFCVPRFGDDLGFNTSTLLSTDDIRAHILPQYRRVTDLVHKSGKPFLLHSCGCLFSVFDDIIDQARIDAKHSNEDNIGHFTVWVDRYGDRIGNFGGIDTDVLCRQSPDSIRQYVLDCLDKVNGWGGIAFASGNSIPDYVPTEGYLAMVETVRQWRGDPMQ